MSSPAAANVKVMLVLESEYGTFLSNRFSSMSCFFEMFEQRIFSSGYLLPHQVFLTFKM